MKDANKKFLPIGLEIIEQLQNLLSRKQHPIVVAIDGGSGAGKSTLALIIKDELDVALIPLDDFFSANIPDSEWDKCTVEEKLKHVFDWVRLRNHAIVPLLKGRPAKWHAFDFQSGLRADGTYGMEKERKKLEPADVILIEGAYSASPELADLIDFAILVDVPIKERHVRLTAREDHDFLVNWHQRWDEVEIYYFNQVRPKSSFDFVAKLK
jgi:uridine kinase